MISKDIAGLRILLIEDESFIRITLRRMLLSLGSAEVQEASDGKSGFALLQGSFLPDLIICDVQMTPVNGLTFLRDLRAMADPARAALPVIMLTAVADEATIHATVDLTVAGYLLKPVSRQQLAERINAIFRGLEASVKPALMASTVV